MFEEYELQLQSSSLKKMEIRKGKRENQTGKMDYFEGCVFDLIIFYYIAFPSKIVHKISLATSLGKYQIFLGPFIDVLQQFSFTHKGILMEKVMESIAKLYTHFI